ncbi:MAG: phosphatidylglycerophosphatase A [Gammaproteobacteria bacterium]|tara:strand:- start:1527 stop:2012 length:486 start_codon:yes stop_codon:yes gene_type:complete
MQKFPNLKNPFHLIATLGGLGLFPIAPGTLGSIVSWVIFIILSHHINMTFLTIAFIFLAIFICEQASKDLVEKDHKSIVLDELVGIWVAMIPVLYISSTQQERIAYAVIALILFRFFDILKPFPISYFDKRFKNGFGIVIDDIVAGIFAGLLASATVILLI